MSRVAQVRGVVINSRTKYDQALGSAIAQASKSAEDRISDANKALLRARLTKLETLCCRTLVKSKTKQKHLTRWCNDFAQETRQRWEDHMAKQLVGHVQQCLQGVSS